jgi:hypothetical protein
MNSDFHRGRRKSQSGGCHGFLNEIFVRTEVGVVTFFAAAVAPTGCTAPRQEFFNNTLCKSISYL